MAHFITHKSSRLFDSRGKASNVLRCLITRKEVPVSHKARSDELFNRCHPAARMSRQHQFVRQPIKEVKWSL
jgi:hypothetical protein